MQIKERNAGSQAKAETEVNTAERHYTDERGTETPVTRPLRNLNSALRRTITRSSGSALVNNLRKLMETYMREQSIEDGAFELLAIDPGRYSVPYPTLAIVSVIEVENTRHAFAFLYPMTAGNSPLPKREVQTNEGPISAPRTWVDNLNTTFLNESRSAIRDDLSGQGRTTMLAEKNIHIVGFTVLPNNISEESGGLAENLLIAADNAIQSMITVKFGSRLGLEKFSMAWTSGEDIISNIQYNANGIQDSDIVGNPVRSDLTVTTSSRLNRVGQDYDTQNTMMTSTGYLDLQYSPQDPVQQLGMGMGQATPLVINGIIVPPTAQYQPQYIMTNMYPVSIDAFTHELFACGLVSTVATLTMGNAWMHMYVTLARKGMGATNPGALAMVLDKTLKTSMDLATESDENIFKLIGSVLYPALSFAIDVPEEGENSWLLRDIASAATILRPADDSGKVTFTAAYERLYKSWDVATGGRFSQLYNKGDALVYDTGNRIALGFYNHQDNRRHDIRDVDDLYMFNQAPNAVAEFEDSFIDAKLSPVTRFTRRNDLYDNLFSHSWTQTGWAKRIEFDPSALAALMQAAVDCGFRLTPENVSRATGHVSRGSSTARSRAMGSANADILNNKNDDRQYGNGGMGNSFSMFE